MYGGRHKRHSPKTARVAVGLLTAVATSLTLTSTPSASAVEPVGQTFTYTGSEQTYTVPAGTTAVTITAVGARGGNGPVYQSNNPVPAGKGARVTSTVTLPAGTTTLYVEVGGVPTDGPGHAGGFNGGGSSTYAASGGGASDVRTTSISTVANSALTAANDTRLVVAGGGGGGGWSHYGICAPYPNKGGDAGAAAVSGAGAGGNGDPVLHCGSGTTSAGGSAGFGGAAGGAAGSGVFGNGSAGSRGLGANNLYGVSPTSYGGAGGGGYFGGGSGGDSDPLTGGGGAGSSFSTAGAGDTVMTTAALTDAPQVQITPVSGGGDTTAPTVSWVTSPKPNGVYKAGTNIGVQVEFSEAVTVTGAPQLVLETGATDRLASYNSGSGSSSLFFSYSVQGGDTSADLNYVDTASLVLNGGTIRDAAGNDAIPTLPALDSELSLGGNKAIVIDTTAPTVSQVVSDPASGAFNAGDLITVFVIFSEDVTVTGTPQLTLETGATDRVVDLAVGTAAAHANFAYTVQAGDTSADLDYASTTALALNGGTITDAAGNNAALTLPASGTTWSLAGYASIVVDTTAPTLTINQAAGQDDPTTSSPVNFTVVFSEPVTGFATGDVSLSGTAGDMNAVVSEISPNDGTTYQVAVSGMTGNGTVIAAVGSGLAADAAGNGNAASTSTDNTVTYNAPDTTAPTVTVEQAAGQADPTSSSPVHFSVVFSESVIGFADADVALGGTAGATTATVSGSGSTYQVEISGMTSDGTVIASVNAGAAVDAAGNGNVASTSTDNTVTYNAPDTTAPTVMWVTSPKPNGVYKSGAVIGVQVEFSEAVTVIGSPQVALETGTTDGVASYSSGSGSSSLFFTYTVQGGDNSADLDYVSTGALTLNGGTIRDAAGNDAIVTLPALGSELSLGGNKSIVIDTTAPTVSINEATGQADPTSSSPVNFTVVFSEPVTGFATGDVAVSGAAGATTAVVSEVSPNDGTTYQVAVSGMAADGTVIASIPAGVATDGAGNGSAASTSTDNTVTYSAPTDPVLTAITELRTDVETLNLGKNANRLLSPLDRATSALQSGRTAAVIRQMDAFSRSVDSLRTKGVVTQSDADHLKGHATEIVRMLQP